MQIALHEIPVRELTAGYVDNQEQGVAGYGGKLDIRPPYQREFIYDCKQHFDSDKMEGDHITPWSQGGKTNDCR